MKRCEYCGKNFKEIPKLSNPKRFCSSTCKKYMVHYRKSLSTIINVPKEYNKLKKDNKKLKSELKIIKKLKKKGCYINHEFNELNIWFAAWFEAKGHIYIIVPNKNRPNNYVFRVDVFLPSKKVANLFKQDFGGHLQKLPNRIKIKKGLNIKILRCKNKYKLSFLSDNGADFLEIIYPFIKTELIKERIDCALKFQKYIRNNFNSQSDLYRQTKKKMYQEMKRLNKKR